MISSEQLRQEKKQEFTPSQETFSFGPKVKILAEQVFYEKDKVFAFVNLRPVIRGHVLICPKRPSVLVNDLYPDEIYEIYRAAQQIGKAFSTYYHTEDFQYTIQDGADAGQSVRHVHLHLLPGKDHTINQQEIFGRPRTLEEMRNEAMEYRKVLYGEK